MPLAFLLATWVVLTLLLSAGLLGIPVGTGVLFTPAFTGAAFVADPIPAPAVPQHPHMARNGFNSMHNDAYATDAYLGLGPLGRDPEVTSTMYGLRECATLAFDTAGRLIGLCGDVTGPTLHVIDPETLALRETHDLPKRVLRAGVSPLEDLCGGAYFYLDDQDRAVVATTNRQIHVIELSSMSLQKKHELSSLVPEDDCLIALMPDWSGQIWFVTSGGRVGAIDPTTGAGQVVTLTGEVIANSLAADETGGVFVVSDHALYRFDANASGLPSISWRQPYDRGARRKPGQLSQGSGTTPTLLGRDRVAITDNAEPRMNVLVYERGRNSQGRFVCGEPVFADGASATENSLVAAGNGLIVENNYGYTGPLSTLFGGVTTAGVARVDVVGDQCRTAWTSPVRAPSSVAKVSLSAGLVYVYAKPPIRGRAVWYLTAIDARTGRTAFSVRTGAGLQWNNHYAAVTLGPDGSFYIATLAGLIRVRDREAG